MPAFVLLSDEQIRSLRDLLVHLELPPYGRFQARVSGSAMEAQKVHADPAQDGLEIPKGIQVRWLIQRDMPEVDSIEREQSEAFPNRIPWGEDEFRTGLRQRNVIGMVAEKDHQIVGFMVYGLHKRALYVVNMASSLAHRNEGILALLVDKLKDKLSQQRRDQVILEAALNDLETERFFMQLGFWPDGQGRLVYQLEKDEVVPDPLSDEEEVEEPDQENLEFASQAGLEESDRERWIQAGRREFLESGSRLQRVAQAVRLGGGNPADWLRPDDTVLAELTGQLMEWGVPPGRFLDSREVTRLLAQAGWFPDPAILREVPVLAGLLSHGDNAISLALLEKFKTRLEEFLQARPQVKRLVVALELGAPFLSELLDDLGLDPGQLRAAAQRDPDGVNRVVRPAFEEAMGAVRQRLEIWEKQVQNGTREFNPDIPKPWMKRLYEILAELARPADEGGRGIQVTLLPENPSFEPWWNFLLAAERERMAMDRLRDDPAAAPEIRAELSAISSEIMESVSSRDDAQFGRELQERMGKMVKTGTLNPSETALLIPRGRMHALRTEALLREQFSHVEMVRTEDLDPADVLDPMEQYEEALVKGGYTRGQAPAEIERLVDEEVAQVLTLFALEQGIPARIFRSPAMELQAAVVQQIGSEHVIDLPKTPEEMPAFWSRWKLRLGDVVMLDVSSGEERSWLPPVLPQGAAVLNVPHIQTAALTLSHWAALIKQALRLDGFLPRINDVNGLDWEAILAADRDA